MAQPKSIKKHLSLILRLLVAALGVTYIAYKLDWHNQIELRPGDYVLDSGQSLHVDKARTYPVITPDFDPAQVTAPLTIDTDASDAMSRPMTIPAARINAQDTPFILRPGIGTTLRHASFDLLLFGLLIIAPIYPITALRWWTLMRARGIDVRPGKAFKLSMVGCFFNYCMPGTTGGDLIKAYYAARRSDRRTDSIMSVFIDRVVGLLGLVLLAGIAGLFMLNDGDPQVRHLARNVTFYIWGAAGVVTVCSAFYFSRRLRKLSGLDALLGRFLKPDSMLGKIDMAAVAYSNHKLVVFVAILMSVPVHLLLAISTAMAGYALGMDAPLGLLLTVVPILFLAGSIPISYQGLGVMEGLAMAMILHPPGATSNQIVGMLLLIRLFQIVYSLTGALFLLKGDIHMHPEREGEPVLAEASPMPVS
ncbi:MAG: lysylphosphatidylglycerol synthase transmembrane domain-containing protein [Phycisphaeraceae bacterium]